MFKLSINYVCRVYCPNLDSLSRPEFRFDVCFRDDLNFTDGKSYDSVVDCTNAMCNFLNKLADYDQRKYANPIVLHDFSYYSIKNDVIKNDEK